MFRRMLPLALAAALVLAAAVPALAHEREEDQDAYTGPTLVVQWNQVLLEAIRQQRLGPPMTARAIGMVYTAGFDAWAAYDDMAVPTIMTDGFRRPEAERTEANRERAYSYAVYRTIHDLFPVARGLARNQMVALGLDPDDASLNAASATGVGNECAAHLLAYRHQDGSNQMGDLHAGAYTDYTGYQPVNTLDQVVDPNRWQPLRFSNGAGGFVAPGFIAPHWGNVRPFALANGAALRPAVGPATFPGQAYERQVDEILRLNANLDDRGKAIAEYWADGPRSELPPGHWTLFAEVVSARDRHTFSEDVKMFFILGNAVQDAGIAVWDAKRFYDSERPITAVRFLKAGQMVRAYVPGVGRTMIRGEQWMPYQPLTFITPPFAEFPSGHSAFSSASAEVLMRFTGSDHFGHSVTVAAGSSKVEPGIAPARPVRLVWESFSAAADEAGFSRQYGGIHFNDGDMVSRKLGRQVGAAVWDKAMEYIHGVSGPVAGDDGDDDLQAGGNAQRPVATLDGTAGRVAVAFSLERDEDVQVSVLDVQGREVARLANGRFTAGRHTLAWDGGDAAPGLYFVSVRHGATRETSRVILTR